jgi:hypothetical protein
LLGAFPVDGLGNGAVIVIRVGSGLGDGGISINISLSLLGLRKLPWSRGVGFIGVVMSSSDGGE